MDIPSIPLFKAPSGYPFFYFFRLGRPLLIPFASTTADPAPPKKTMPGIRLQRFTHDRRKEDSIFLKKSFKFIGKFPIPTILYESGEAKRERKVQE